MRRVVAVSRFLTRGHPLRLTLIPVTVSLVVFALMLGVLAPAFGRLEDSRGAPVDTGDETAPPPAPRAHPNFTVAVGLDDEPREMPAIQSAKVDFLSFSDQFAQFLEHGGLAPDFGTEERVLSPDAARAQVEDGTSVLAVILPADLTGQVMTDIRDYLDGAIDGPKYTITIVAGPQALNEDEHILQQYRSQVITQAVEQVSEQIRTVASKSDCQGLRAQRCERGSAEATLAFEQPFDVTVDTVAGPAPVDYFTTGAEAVAAPETQAPSVAASDPAPRAPAESSAGSPLAWTTALLSALAIASAALALTSTFLVNRAAGLQILIIGPWRSLLPQKPVQRRDLLEVKVSLAVLGSAVLSVAATTALLVGGAGVHFGAYPAVRVIAVTVLLGLICAAIATSTIVLNEVLGGIAGVMTALTAATAGIATSGLGAVLGITESFGSAEHLGRLISGSLGTAGPSAAAALLLFGFTAALAIAGTVITMFYDRRVSAQIALVD